MTTAAERVRHARYNASEKGRARSARYEASDKGRARQAKYWDSIKGQRNRLFAGLRRRQLRHAAMEEALYGGDGEERT